MKEYHSMSSEEKDKIADKIKEILAEKGEVVFAVAYGSFLSSPSFRDIDIGIYLKSVKKEDILSYEAEIAGKIAEACNLPIDIIEITILNFAPVSFLANIFSTGRIVFSRDQKILTDLIEKSSLEAIANECIAAQSLKELIPAQNGKI